MYRDFFQYFTNRWIFHMNAFILLINFAIFFLRSSAEYMYIFIFESLIFNKLHYLYCSINKCIYGQGHGVARYDVACIFSRLSSSPDKKLIILLLIDSVIKDLHFVGRKFYTKIWILQLLKICESKKFIFKLKDEGSQNILK